jgi:hypothetical protein
MYRRKLFARSKARAFKQASVRALAAIEHPSAADALRTAAQRGDRLLKRAAREAGEGL